MELSIFELPFMQRAFIGGGIVSILLACLGVFVVLRRSSFFGDAIAHSSLTGVAIGLLMGVPTIIAATLYAIGVSFFIPWMKEKSRLPVDTLLGILLPVSMALGVIILTLIPGYRADLMSFLFGSILGISWVNIGFTLLLSLAIGIFLFFWGKQLLALSFDSDYAVIQGIHVNKIDLLYHLALAVSIVLGIQVVGIILVNALLIVPSATARLLARSMKELFILAPIIAFGTTISGIVLSYYLNLPTGPAIGVLSGIVFVIGFIVHNIKSFSKISVIS